MAIRSGSGGLFGAMTALVAACKKHAMRATTRLRGSHPSFSNLARAIPFVGKKMGSRERKDEEGEVWRRAILMGEKCQPLEFSGVIYYDYEGRQVMELPKTPRSPIHPALTWLETEQHSILYHQPQTP